MVTSLHAENPNETKNKIVIKNCKEGACYLGFGVFPSKRVEALLPALMPSAAERRQRFVKDGRGRMVEQDYVAFGLKPGPNTAIHRFGLYHGPEYFTSLKDLNLSLLG
ncbi:hypothetical protein PIB30_009751 [Stylosanthes scabra]|uniref:Uncharacterized protein n=1 Tax=Stylosanthes scabra TaxID=79078 RepID=A0ABU6X600_9FABA|nr:hypothetical protein [Stylosanthes scabra]